MRSQPDCRAPPADVTRPPAHGPNARRRPLHPAHCRFRRGATGYTGARSFACSSARGVRTVAHVRPDSPRLEEWRQRFEGAGAAVDSTSWGDAEMVHTLSTLQPTHVFSLLGTTRARRRESATRGATESYEAIDFGLTAMLIRAAVASGSKPRFVYLSSLGRSRAHVEPVPRGAVAGGIVAAREWACRTSSHDRPSSRVPGAMNPGLWSVWARPLWNALASVARVAGAARLADSMRSLTGAELAEGLVRYAFDASVENATVGSDELHPRPGAERMASGRRASTTDASGDPARWRRLRTSRAADRPRRPAHDRAPSPASRPASRTARVARPRQARERRESHAKEPRAHPTLAPQSRQQASRGCEDDAIGDHGMRERAARLTRTKIRVAQLDCHRASGEILLAQVGRDARDQPEQLAMQLVVALDIALERILAAQPFRNVPLGDRRVVDAAHTSPEPRRLAFADEARERRHVVRDHIAYAAKYRVRSRRSRNFGPTPGRSRARNAGESPPRRR